MKRIEVICDGKRVTILRESKEWFTGEQKYYLTLAAVFCGSFCFLASTFLSLFR